MINCYFNTDAVLANMGSFLTLESLRRLSSLTFFSNYSETLFTKNIYVVSLPFFFFSQLLDSYNSGMIDPNDTQLKRLAQT